MSLNISSSTAASALAPVAPLAPPPVSGGDDSAFHNVLSDAIQEVASAQSSANESVNQFLSGEGSEDLHSTILATQRADLEFQMFLQVRNKVVSAYQEVMKMQL
jgi:flagellar hook-basal body complex protein FliE